MKNCFSDLTRPPASFKTSLDRHLSDGKPWPVKSGQSNPNNKIDRSHIPVLEQPLVRREEPGGNRLSAEFERSPFNKPLPPLPTTGGAGSVYLADADAGGDVDMVPRRRAPPPPSGPSSWATTTTTTTDAGPSVNVSKLKGMFEKWSQKVSHQYYTQSPPTLKVRRVDTSRDIGKKPRLRILPIQTTLWSAVVRTASVLKWKFCLDYIQIKSTSIPVIER